jgi:predicted nucleotidyltransferase
MNNVPLDNALIVLTNLKLIKEEDKLYSLNLENEIVQQFMNERQKLSNLPLKVQFILLDFIDEVINLKSINQIILFGSYAKLIFSEKSDIDIAIIFSNKIKNKEKTEKKILAFESKISKKHKKSVQIHFFTASDLKHKEDPLIKDILRNGISLL